jgi:hypothetical protein
MELWYRLDKIPDLTLNKYSSLEERGVDGVLKKHIPFLRQLNRKGIVSNVSFHLFYLYIGPDIAKEDTPGYRLNIFLMAKGEKDDLKSVQAILKSSSLAEFYSLNDKMFLDEKKTDASIDALLLSQDIEKLCFEYCVSLTKAEKHITKDNETYFSLQEWECNEDGRLYNLCKMMEALNRTVLYRVDLYPTDKSTALRETLHKPMSILRKRQEEHGFGVAKDYEGKDVVKQYEKLIEQYETEPHYIVNVFVFGNVGEEIISLIDAVGSESLLKGKYEIAKFHANEREQFTYRTFLDKYDKVYQSEDGRVILAQGTPGSIICQKETASINLNYLPTLFTLDEVAPFFRLPALYDGESIQIVKETAPQKVKKEGALFLGKDDNGYDVYFPIKLFSKHAFISGVPGSGKTNTMHHITSSLWEKNIPFLVLEPAKKEYRALLNDDKMKGVYLFSPNADMSFPLHINPFEMPKGILISEHIRSLCSVFEGAFPFDPPAPFILDTSIEAVYRELGWHPDDRYCGNERNEDGSKKQLPTISMLYDRFEKETEATSYGEETKGGLKSILQVRIGSLLRREMGDIFDVSESTFRPEDWLTNSAIIELESMGTGPANFLTLMLCSLIRETLKVNPQFDGDVRHVIFIEEAHNLIGPESEEQTGADADPKQAATAFVVKMLAEVRALKEGIVIADQLPTVMAQEVLKNTGLKIGLRITSADDRALLGSTMAASSMQLEQMSTFPVGEALIFYEKLMRPFTMKINEWCGEIENTVEKNAMVSSKNDIDLSASLISCNTYKYATERSVYIIGKKYRQKLNGLENSIIGNANFFKQSAIACKEYRLYLDLVLDDEINKKVLTDAEKIKKYDDVVRLKNILIEMLGKIDDVLDSTLNIYDMIKEWCDGISRLKKGRWARYKLTNELLREITELELNMYEKTNIISKSFDSLGVELAQLQDLEIKGIIKKATTKKLFDKILHYLDLIHVNEEKSLQDLKQYQITER